MKITDPVVIERLADLILANRRERLERSGTPLVTVLRSSSRCEARVAKTTDPDVRSTRVEVSQEEAGRGVGQAS